MISEDNHLPGRKSTISSTLLPFNGKRKFSLDPKPMFFEPLKLFSLISFNNLNFVRSLNGFKDFILIFVGNGFSGFSFLRIDI